MRRSATFRKNQHGATAIEFAVLFGAFFTVLYAIIAYSLPLLLMLTFKQLTADAAREAIAVDHTAEGSYALNLEKHVRRVIVEESWIGNTGWYATCDEHEGSFSKLDGRKLSVCIRYKSSNYNSDPIAPALALPGIGQIPRLPDLIESRSSIRL